MSYYEIENLFMVGFMVNGMQFIRFRYVESLESVSYTHLTLPTTSRV